MIADQHLRVVIQIWSNHTQCFGVTVAFLYGVTSATFCHERVEIGNFWLLGLDGGRREIPGGLWAGTGPFTKGRLVVILLITKETNLSGAPYASKKQPPKSCIHVHRTSAKIGWIGATNCRSRVKILARRTKELYGACGYILMRVLGRSAKTPQF